MEKMDYDSCVNQDIKRTFIGRDVYCCATTMVNELITANSLDSELGFDYLENLIPYGEYDFEELTEEERDEKIEELEEKIDILDEIHEYYYDGEDSEDYIQKTNKANYFIDELNRIIDELNDMNFDNYPEVYEWWLVSNNLARRLKSHGHIIVDDYTCSIWGRQCSGQAILLDNVISVICEEMEILDGQRFSWKKD